MKKYNFRILVAFLIALLIYVIAGRFLMDYEWSRSIIFAIYMGAVVVLPMFFFYRVRYPMYLDRTKYDEIMAVLEETGIEQLNQHGDKSVYKLSGYKWPNKIRIIKRPFSLFVEVPIKAVKLLEKFRVDHH